MPVWHEATKRWRESGDLVVLGLTQEQHPERCRLFAQWHGIQWPIVWDPLNTTGSKVVPRFIAIDEHGVVRDVRARPKTLEAFMGKTFKAPAEVSLAAKDQVGALSPPIDATSTGVQKALSRLLWKRGEDPTPAIDSLQKTLAGTDDAALRFRLGVAYRMRHDSGFAQPGDFRRALEHWRGALRARPDQYIWRRRIQQYGPQLDKPYPFYSWIETARRAVTARGETPVTLPVPLSGAERVAPRAEPGAVGAAPDPGAKIPVDKAGLVRCDTAIAWHTTSGKTSARLHLTFRPDATKKGHWNNGAGPLHVWLEAPKDWTLERQLLTHPVPAAEVSSEPRVLDVEVLAPRGRGSGTLKGYALYAVCEDVDGQCLYLRQELQIEVGRPK